MSKPEALPCPFCNSSASLKHVLAGPRVTCSACMACGPTTDTSEAITDADFQAGDVQAINAWNARAADKARIAELTDLCERLKQEAQIQAQEARTANGTIAEIYQIVTGKTGEPGNWNGAEPVRKRIAELEVALRAFTGAAYPVSTQLDGKGYGWSTAYLDEALAIAKPLLAQQGKDGET